MSARVPPCSPLSLLPRMPCTIGMAYESVLPDPVRARARMSREDESACGIKAAWIGVGFGNERCATARSRRGCRGGSNALKSLIVTEVVVVVGQRTRTPLQKCRGAFVPDQPVPRPAPPLPPP